MSDGSPEVFQLAYFIAEALKTIRAYDQLQSSPLTCKFK